MAVVKVKPTSPGRRAVVKVVHKHLHKGKPEASLLEPQFQHSGRNNNGHITIRHKGGGHKHHYRVVDFVRNKDARAGQGRAHRVRPEPHRAHRAGVLRRRRAPLHHRPARAGGGCHDRQRLGSADQGWQHAADPQHPGGLHRALRRDAARQGRADRALGRHLGHADGARRHLRAVAAALGRSAQDPHRLPRHHRRGQQRRTQPAPVRQGRCASAGRASARRCAAWR